MKPSERIKEIILEVDNSGLAKNVTRDEIYWAAVLTYLDEEYEKINND